MLINILALVAILLIAGYYATQGLFSATLSLVTAIFASILAMALFEPLGIVIGSYKPAHARGVTFLLLFLLALSLLRLASDYAVPKGIKFTSKIVDSVAGGIVGFFAAMIIVGTALIGFEMLPIKTRVFDIAGMGFDRYSNGMVAREPGVAEAPANVWLLPDRFTLAVWNGASGRSLGGFGAFGDVHPDFTVESYGYRHTVEYAANSVLVPDLLHIDAAYYSDSPEVLQRFHITDGNKQGAMVRIVVDRGTDQPKVSADAADGNFRITASNLRLVTDKGNQYYPTGHLVNGTTFEELPLNSGHLIDDYQGGKVVEDWVFQIDRDEKPKFIEVKQLARVDLADKLSPKPVPAAAVATYPKRPYRFTHATLNILVTTPSGAPIGGAKVFLMPTSTKLRTVRSEVQAGYNSIMAAVQAINDGGNLWATNQGKPGVPDDGVLKSQMRQTRDQVTSKGLDDEVQWSQAIPSIMYGSAKPDGSQNVTGMPLAFDSKVVPLLGPEIRAKGVTTAQGRLSLTGIAPGNYQVIVSGGTVDTYGLWVDSVTLKPREEQQLNLVTNKALVPIVLK